MLSMRVMVATKKLIADASSVALYLLEQQQVEHRVTMFVSGDKLQYKLHRVVCS